MDKETDDFETNPSFEKEGRAAGGERSFSNTWSSFPETKAEWALQSEAVQDGAIIGKSGAKNTCLFLETATLGTCPLYVCSLDSASVGTDPLLSWW